MIDTPLGNISIYIDGQNYNYCERKHEYPHPPVIGNALDGCYRILVPATSAKRITCILDAIEIASLSSGENYLSAEFRRESIMLSLGMIDENVNFNSKLLEHGLEYELLSATESVVFGIAWTISSLDGDCRTWYAADPSLDSE